MTASYAAAVDFTNSISDTTPQAGQYLFSMRMAMVGQPITVSATCTLDPVTRRRMLANTKKKATKKTLLARVAEAGSAANMIIGIAFLFLALFQ